MPYRLAYRVEVIFSIEALRLLFTNNSRYKNKRLKKKTRIWDILRRLGDPMLSSEVAAWSKPREQSPGYCVC